MTHEQRKAVERLTQHVEARTARYGTKRDDAFTSVTFADLRTLLALVRPVASVEGEITRMHRGVVLVDLGSDMIWLPEWPGATVGQRVRVAVHAVDAGEEK